LFSTHEFALGFDHNLLPAAHIGPEMAERRTREEQLGPEFHGDVARDLMEKTDAQIAGHRLNTLAKQAVRHGRIQQRGDNAAMEDVVVPPQLRSRHKFCPDSALFRFLERETPGARMEIAAEEALGVATLDIGGS